MGTTASNVLQAICHATDEGELRAALFGPNGSLVKLVGVAPEQEIRTLVDVALRRLADLRFDEFHQPAITDWKRVRASIEHENLLTNHRITWLMSSQGFLFAAYAAVFKEWLDAKPEHIQLYSILLLMIAVFGVMICAVSRRALTAAGHQLRDLDYWWHSLRPRSPGEGPAEVPTGPRGKKRELQKEHPPLQGSLRVLSDAFLATDNLPLYFGIFWGGAVILTGFSYAAKVWNAVANNWLYIAFALLVPVVAVLLYQKRRDTARIVALQLQVQTIAADRDPAEERAIRSTKKPN